MEIVEELAQLAKSFWILECREWSVFIPKYQHRDSAKMELQRLGQALRGLIITQSAFLSALC